MSIVPKTLHDACCRVLRTALAAPTSLLGIPPKPRLTMTPATRVLVAAGPFWPMRDDLSGVQPC